MKLNPVNFINRLKTQRFKLNTKLLGYTILAAPISVVLHEMGHALAAFLIGYSNLYITFRSWGGVAPSGITGLDRAWTSFGGPIASFLIILFSYGLIRTRYPDFFRSLGLMASIQFVGAFLYVIGSILGIEPSSVFDSARAANYLGESIFLFSIPGSLILVSTWVLFIKSIDNMSWKRDVLSMIIGGFFGFVIWFILVGPLILPH